MLLGVFGGRVLEGAQTKWRMILQALQGNADGIPQAPLRNEFPFQNLPVLVIMLFIVEFPTAYPTIGTRKIRFLFPFLLEMEDKSLIFSFFRAGVGGKKKLKERCCFNPYSELHR